MIIGEVAIAKMLNIHIDSLDSIFGYMQIGRDFVGYTLMRQLK
jgi:hypothetical protein